MDSIDRETSQHPFVRKEPLETDFVHPFQNPVRNGWREWEKYVLESIEKTSKAVESIRDALSTQLMDIASRLDSVNSEIREKEVRLERETSIVNNNLSMKIADNKTDLTNMISESERRSKQSIDKIEQEITSFKVEINNTIAEAEDKLKERLTQDRQDHTKAITNLSEKLSQIKTYVTIGIAIVGAVMTLGGSVLFQNIFDKDQYPRSYYSQPESRYWYYEPAHPSSQQPNYSQPPSDLQGPRSELPSESSEWGYQYFDGRKRYPPQRP